MDGAALGRLIALLLPVALLGGALSSQYLGGLHPCEMCYWQRWPHAAAILLAALAFTAPAGSGRSRSLALLAAAAIAAAALKEMMAFHPAREMPRNDHCTWSQRISGTRINCSNSSALLAALAVVVQLVTPSKILSSTPA
ncbi:MAG: disulfide bond formation protein B [Sphingomonas sp.]|nr:disulfide bond formation protein B [Sphingomonas sp.]